MKKRYYIIGGSLFSLTLVSCGCTGCGSKKTDGHDHQSGVAVGRASVIRKNYHYRQLIKEKPDFNDSLLPPKRRYYEVPIPAYTTSDGVKIEAHTQTIQVIQP